MVVRCAAEGQGSIPSITVHTVLFFCYIQDGLTALMISSRSGRADLTETLLLGENTSLDIQAVRN